MFTNVLVGIDGRPNGRDAIALATRLAAPCAKLTLAHVHSGALRPSHANSPNVVREERYASQRLLAHERESTHVDAGLISIEATSPGRGLHVQAEDQGADLLVVGSCSHGALGRAMLGDHTRSALNGASCAVAVAPVGFSERPTPISRVGVGYNDSPESEAALNAARELAAQTGGTVHALEVVSIPTITSSGVMLPSIGDSIDAILEEASERMQELAGADGRAVYGLAGEELASFSGTVDLLIVGSRGYGPLKRLVLGSTSDYLERHVRSSLLVLPRVAAAASLEDAGGSREEPVGATA
jgi:nucleotide-binding universal stress UspA family protein